MYFKLANKNKIYYNYLNKESKKPPILFIHAFAMNWTCLKGEIKKLKAQGYPLIYLDLPGHGKSDIPKKYNGFLFETIVEEIKELLDFLKIKKIICVGYSMGGIIASEFAIKNPKLVSKLIIINSSDKSPDSYKLFKKFKGTHIFKTLYNLFSNKKLPLQKKQDLDILKTELHCKNLTSFFFKCLFESNFKTVFYFADLIFNTNIKNLNKIKCPTLILHSKQDQFFSKKENITLSKKIKDSVYKEILGGHDNAIINSEIISDEILKFIN